MRVSELFRGHQVEVTGDDREVTALAYDSRKVRKGGLFAALSGAEQDGHEYVAAAIKAGARTILCEKRLKLPKNCTRVLSANPRVALARAGRRFYGDPSQHMTMVGVTGTNGKTTTTLLVQQVLEGALRPAGVIGTLGARYRAVQIETGLTTPESIDIYEIISRMELLGARAIAMEVSSHALEQGRVAGLDFDVTVFTNLTHDHLDYHGTLESYFAAKSRLVRERQKPGGRSVLNIDDPWVRQLVQPVAWTFSAKGHPDARLRALKAEITLEGILLQVASPAGMLTVRSPLIGRFNVENLLAAMAVGLALGLPAPQIVTSLESVKGIPGRLERVSQPGEPLVLVDYAHTPDALEKALRTTREVTQGRLICIVGCGGDRDPTKRQPMGETAAKLSNHVIVTSDNPRSEDPRVIARAIEEGVRRASARAVGGGSDRSYEVELDRRRAIEKAVAMAMPGDAVLVAGKGHETVQIVGTEKLPFDDRKIARAALDARRAGASSTGGLTAPTGGM